MKKILVVATVMALTVSAPSAFAAQAKNTGLVGGAIAGAIAGGPVGAVVGGAVGYMPSPSTQLWPGNCGCESRARKSAFW